MHLNKASLEADQISLSYGDVNVLNNITIKIEPGEFFALLGPSGSGKSTLLRLIAGFNQHQKGRLLVDGQDITGVPPHLRNIGMVFQNYALWPHMSVWDNVAFGLVERRESKEQIKKKVGAALELVGLDKFADRKPNQLSGGQQQRVALARTIVIEPKLLLLDEPLSNLDKNLRVQMRDELKNLQKELGVTTIFVTHDQEEAMTTADRMAVLDKGILQQVGSADTLFDYPVNKFVAGFVGTTNLLDGQLTQVNADGIHFSINGIGNITIPQSNESVAPGPYALSFRPHVVHLQASGDRSPDKVWFSGVIEGSEFLGESSRYRVKVGEHVIIANQTHFAGLSRFSNGLNVQLGIDPSQIRFLNQ
jgi:iron(III) transport system ATP-binding protein